MGKQWVSKSLRCEFKPRSATSQLQHTTQPLLASVSSPVSSNQSNHLEPFG